MNQSSQIISKVVLCSDFESGMAAFADERGQSLEASPNILVIRPEETTIGIEVIRDLQVALSTPAGAQTRLVFIGPAEKITQPAQQALLKLLEEPPENTELCLFARSQSDVLPTILSRCFVLDRREGREGESSTFLVPLSQAKTTKDKLIILASFPTQRDAAREFLFTELGATAQLTPNEKLIKMRQVALEVLESLQSNVTPALCADQFLA